jgi:hypothetical protein
VRTPTWVYAASIGAGVLGVFLPAFAPGLVTTWEGSSGRFAAAAFAAVVVHALLHLVLPKARILPGALVTLCALGVAFFASAPLGFAALVANISASGPDVYELLAERT